MNFQSYIRKLHKDYLLWISQVIKSLSDKSGQKTVLDTYTQGASSSLLSTSRSVQPFLVRFQSEIGKKTRFGGQMGGFEHVPEMGGNKWRKSFEERGFWQSKIGLFDSKTFKGDKFTFINPDNFKYMRSIKEWWKYHLKSKLVLDQQFSEERLAILGPDLSAAHFTVFRGGAVKFYNIDNWIKDDTKLKDEYDDDLPNTYDSSYVVEGLDLSGTAILYEGLVNLERLRKLKWFSVAKCVSFDNWCLDKISSEYSDTLEHLDISYTTVTYPGLNALYRFRALKTLVLDDLSEDIEFFQMCSELKKIIPGLKIEGVSTELYADSGEQDKLQASG